MDDHEDVASAVYRWPDLIVTVFSVQRCAVTHYRVTRMVIDIKFTVLSQYKLPILKCNFHIEVKKNFSATIWVTLYGVRYHVRVFYCSESFCCPFSWCITLTDKESPRPGKMRSSSWHNISEGISEGHLRVISEYLPHVVNICK